MVVFVPGLELSRRFFREVVHHEQDSTGPTQGVEW
jgi:hypothetical protein